MPRYLAITPARDEQELLPGLISSLSSQTVRPATWVIVDDGSTDRTAEIVDRAAADFDWIEVHHLERDRPRGAGGESVVMRFLPRDRWRQYDYILRLDADLTFASDFASRLFREFERNPKLGIAGPVLWEPSAGQWCEQLQPLFHTRGAAKMYSRACFSAINGMLPGPGWDTLDEARAMMLGFRTSSFRHIRADHHRPQGAANGSWHGRFTTGQAAYQIGYSPMFVMARALRRMMHRPYVVEGAAMLAGYFDGYLHRRPRAASADVVRFVRHQQHRRLLRLGSLWQ